MSLPALCFYKHGYLEQACITCYRFWEPVEGGLGHGSCLPMKSLLRILLRMLLRMVLFSQGGGGTDPSINLSSALLKERSPALL